jgi:TonB family protein
LDLRWSFTDCFFRDYPLFAGSSRVGQFSFYFGAPSSPPSCRSCPQPDFPSEARKAKISSALVVLDAMISADRQPDDIRIVSDPGHGFAYNAVKAVRKWKFKPAATKDGKKVPTRTKIEITFRE